MLSNVVKKLKQKLLKAIVEPNVYAWLPYLHVWGPRNPGKNLIYSFFTKIWHLLKLRGKFVMKGKRILYRMGDILTIIMCKIVGVF